jgi:signal transduction histidine kinase
MIERQESSATSPQLDHTKHNGSDRTLDFLSAESAIERREHAAQRLSTIGEMTEGIAHDFRNILAIIESGLTLADKNLEQPESIRVYLAGAREGVDRGLRLISQLLTFAKQQQLEAEEGNANDLLKSLEVFL